MFKTIVATFLLLGFLGSIAGCNTVSGLGKDIERAGEATSDTARDIGKRL